jgi:hypothetical protein
VRAEVALSLHSGLSPSALAFHQINASCVLSQKSVRGLPDIDWFTAGGDLHPALRIGVLTLIIYTLFVNHSTSRQ